MGWERERETIQRDTRTQRESRVSWDTDVIVPFGQSVLIASGMGVGTFVVTVLVAIWLAWPFWAPLAAAGRRLLQGLARRPDKVHGASASERRT